MHLRSIFLIALALLLARCSPICGGEAGKLAAALPEKAGLFEKLELTLSFPADLQDTLDRLPDTQIHDAYDADRNGAFVNIWAEFSGPDGKCSVPAFAIRQSPDAPWLWRVRFSPRRIGAYSVSVHALVCEGACSTQPSSAVPKQFHQDLPAKITVEDHGLPGPLVSPEADAQPRLLRRLNAAGGSEALWLFGACRAWVAETGDSRDDWRPDEWLDRDTELFPPMRASGYNLLNQWMAPWEFLLVHHDRAEFWKDERGRFKRVPLPKDQAWTSYQCFDQGRAAAFDQLVEKCEGDKEKDLIYLLLSPLPHNAVESSSHLWGGQESGFSPSDDKGRQSAERLNGFSGFQPGKGLKLNKFGVWDFFAADPAAPLGDWRSQLFDHQANFYRYVIARWGYSRAIGVWVLADELDAVGDEVGNFRLKTGWWGHADCEVWLANLIRMFRGNLKRSDGLPYAGDPFHHPLHASSTSSRGQADRGGNIDWDGGPIDARPDLFGFHWYPYWPKGSTWTDVWEYVIDGIDSYAQAPIGNRPHLMSEFGTEDREKPSDEPSKLYPTFYHHAIWAAIFCGHAGTPMDWDDGKEFGELAPRKRPGIFDAAHYPIDNPAQLRALRKFLGPLKPDALRPCGADDAAVKCSTSSRARAYALYAPQNTSVYGWMFSRGEFATVVSLRGLKAGRYTLTWFDPWTGDAVGAPSDLDVPADVSVALDANETLKTLSKAAPEFPKNTRLSRGQDVAFKLERSE